jgi:DNA topoisomerase IA
VTTVQAGTVSAPAITTTGDTNTGIFFPAADTIAFAEGGAEAMRITSAGNLGIGTNAPDTLVHIQSAASGIIRAKIKATSTMVELKSHYTEAGLIKLLEECGIGRPSTFSSLIEKIQKRGYVMKEDVKGKKMKCVDFELLPDELQELQTEREFGGEKNKLVLQPLGTIVIDFLVTHFDSLFQYDFT